MTPPLRRFRLPSCPITGAAICRVSGWPWCAELPSTEHTDR